MAADERHGLLQVVRILADPPIGPAKVFAPRRAQHDTGVLGLEQSLLGRAVAAELARRQVAQPHAQTERRVPGDGAAESDLEVVGVRTEYEQVEWHLMFFTGAGAPPPARAYADASPRLCSASARHGRRRPFNQNGAAAEIQRLRRKTPPDRESDAAECGSPGTRRSRCGSRRRAQRDDADNCDAVR